MSIEERRIVAEPTKILEDVLLQESDPQKFTRIGTSMKEKAKKDLVQFLRNSIDVFAWNHDDMPSIDPSRDIEANPDKIQAILNMEPPKNIKEVQSLTGRVAALNKFVSKATDKCLPFFKILRKEEKLQKTVYYTSRALRGAIRRYPLIEKLAFALITASRKLRHYFQVHVINVMTDHLLKKAMKKLEAAGRLIQWVVEFSEFDIRYQPRNAIKAQALTNFIAEFTLSYDDLDERKDNKKWVFHVDGSSMLHAGVEYEALLKRLELAKSMEADSILFLGDSQLVIGQVNGTYEAKEDRMKRYLKKVIRLVKKFKEADFVQIPRKENMEADTLVKEASANEAKEEFDKVQYMPSIDLLEVLQIEGEEYWMTLIVL
ncbi:uncharacterized protein LOC136070054 [Quercus suber]|uniref:uncharacterized protein LOC136070054 n=1 Tax=Quercus suber TaxID=58331 RepID=UPI0032DE51B4